MGPHDSLIAYVKAQRGKQFLLGEHDCFTFTNGGWRAMHGMGYADQIVGKYADLGPKSFDKLMKEAFGTSNLIAALDLNMRRVNGFPPKGALIAMKSDRPYFTGFAFGLSMGTQAVFVGEHDVVYMPMSQIEGAWV